MCVPANCGKLWMPIPFPYRSFKVSFAMKYLSRVVWTEGMYLGPHHFQAQSRYFEDSIGFALASLWRYAWGLLHLALDQEAIANGNAVVLQASGIFPDGLAFDVPNADPAPEPRHVSDVFAPTDASLDLFLAVPRRQDAGGDYSDDPGMSSRFTGMRRTLRDETNGMDEREVELGRKNLRLVTAAEITPQMTTLPVARVLRDGRGHQVYDAQFVPACLRLNASEPLMLSIKRLIETVQENSSTITRGARPRGKFEAGNSALDVADYWFLHALYSALPPLRHLQGTKHCHPEEMFSQLLQLAGALCTFALDSDPSTLPQYDHANPGPGFALLDAHIRRHLEIIVPSNTLKLAFKATGPYISEAQVGDERCLRRARWILGMRADLGEADLMRLVPQLVKICSARFVPELVKRALPGMALIHLPVPPSTIRPEPDMQYFALNLSGPCWEHILQTQTVGIYVPGEIAKAEFELTAIVEPS